MSPGKESKDKFLQLYLRKQVVAEQKLVRQPSIKNHSKKLSLDKNKRHRRHYAEDDEQGATPCIPKPSKQKIYKKPKKAVLTAAVTEPEKSADKKTVVDDSADALSSAYLALFVADYFKAK